MIRRMQRSLRLEALETREVPAVSVISAGGTLTIIGDNLPNNLALAQQPGGQIKVTNNAVNIGTYAAGGNVFVNMGNGADTVAVSLFAGKGLGGNLSVNTGNSNDVVDLGGDFLGGVTVNTGFGDDTVTATVTDVTVGGNLLYTDLFGTNVFDLNDRGFAVAGNLTLNGASVVDMGTGNTLSVGGSAIITGPSSGKLTAQFNGANFSVAKTTLITGGGLNDVVSVTAQVNLAGNVQVNLNGGDNTFVLTPAAGGAVGGSLNYFGGAGVDVVVFGADSLVAGRTGISVGNGINTFVDTPTSQYAGALALTGGNGTHTNVVTGTVGGNLEVTLGNGDGHTTVVTGSVGGTFRYRGGNGNLGVLTVAPAAAALINADCTFGAGSFTLTLGPNVTLNGIVRGTVGAAYTFNQGTAILGNIVFINFP